MRTTKTISVSMPPSQWKAMVRTAKKENRTMSELVRELYRRYIADSAGKLTMRQIDAEIAAARRERRRTKQPTG
jgi:metal-responsive CopG/Arc/MetJ family transcriptional regulator